ncbi:hypothetical protein HUU42_15375 [bacterium]|nr:hypothetical protein [bacterium]
MNQSELGGRKGSIKSMILPDQSHCLTLDQMINYSKGNLPNREQFLIEKHLLDCELCSEAMRHLPADKEAFRIHAQSLEKRIRNYSASKGVISKKFYQYAAAAILLIGFSIAMYISQRNPYGVLVAENLEPYPNTNPLVRGEKQINYLEKALMHYELAEYSPAIKDFLQELAQNPDNITARFYLGVSYLMTDDSKLAIPELSAVTGVENSQFYEASLWYLALAYLDQAYAEQARALLNELVTLKGSYGDEAQKLIDDLKALQ